MNYAMTVFSGCGLAALLVVPAVICTAEGSVPDWAYDVMNGLAEAGYVVLPGNGAQGLSRQQMAMLTAQALKRMDDANNLQAGNQAVALTREYTAITRLSVQDEMQERMLKEWIARLESEYKTAFNAVKSDMQESARYSGQTGDAGQRRLQYRQNSEALDKAAVDLANAEAQLKRHQIMMQQTQARKAAIEQSMVTARLPVEASDQPAAADNEASADDAAADGTDAGTEPAAADDDAAAADTGDAGAADGTDTGTGTVQPASSEELLRSVGDLRVEFAAELADMGYFDDVAAQSQVVAQTTPKQSPPAKRLRVDGEVRADYGRNSGPQSIGNRGRLRLRLYPDYNIDGNWHAIGMIESEKAFIGEGSDGKIKLDRYYLHGHSGATLLDIGAYSTLMAEGNIYDSKFVGVRAQAGGPVKYTAEVGKIDAAHRASTLTASYRTDDYLLEGGWYHFDSIYGGAPRTIYMANFRKPMGWFDFGAMFLHGADRDQGNGNGYVLTLSHGREDSWNPGTYSVYAKYYHQPASTYVEHTMNGMADYMAGFEGFGLGYSYTLQKDWVLSLEYDHLRDLRTHCFNNTIWGSITYFFKNYRD